MRVPTSHAFCFAVLLVLATSACGEDAAPAPTPTSVPGAPTVAPTATPPTSEAMAGSLPLPAGPPISLTVGCQFETFVGPFALGRSGESVTLTGTSRSPSGSQVCAPTVEWVDGAGAFVAVSGLGCAEGPTATSSDLAYEYSPDNGGASANPVYLRIHREDAEGCSPVEVTLARR